MKNVSKFNDFLESHFSGAYLVLSESAAGREYYSPRQRLYESCWVAPETILSSNSSWPTIFYPGGWFQVDPGWIFTLCQNFIKIRFLIIDLESWISQSLKIRLSWARDMWSGVS